GHDKLRRMLAENGGHDGDRTPAPGIKAKREEGDRSVEAQAYDCQSSEEDPYRARETGSRGRQAQAYWRLATQDARRVVRGGQAARPPGSFEDGPRRARTRVRRAVALASVGGIRGRRELRPGCAVAFGRANTRG